MLGLTGTALSSTADELHLSESPEHDRRKDGAVIYLYVSDADAVFESWSSSGVKSRFIPPHDTPYGLREIAFVDRDGSAHRVGRRWRSRDRRFFG
jgi:uncharacterized glyoxalase superfamily protein PhnB